VPSVAVAASALSCRRHRPEQTALCAIVAEQYPRFVETIEASGGRLRVAAPAHPCARGISASIYVIACIEEPWLIRKILGHVRQQKAHCGVTARGPPLYKEAALPRKTASG
jgi:hypothetical protein